MDYVVQLELWVQFIHYQTNAFLSLAIAELASYQVGLYLLQIRIIHIDP